MKVLGFDSWTGGAHHFERLVNAFNANGIDLMLLHLGSWADDPGRPHEERIGALPVRDIAFYGGASFDEILDRERPDAVLFLSTRTFAHRAFQRYCRQRGIPTVHLYHGLMRVQPVDGQAVAYKPNPLSYLRFAVGRVGKSIRHTWPAYARALLKTSATPREWWRFVEDLRDGSIGKLNKSAADDARTTRCCVYTAADVQHATRMYGFDPAEVIPVGNPDLLSFGLDETMLGEALAPSSAERSEVMYIDTALIATGLIFRSDAEYVEHIAWLAATLRQQGKRLLFKPHRDTRARGIATALAGAGIEVVENAEFIDRLRHCCASIVETTTLAMVPALRGMPIFFATFGKMKVLQFGEVLRTYPRSRALDHPDQFTALLDAERSTCDADAARAWIHENAGPLPSAEMPARVARVIMDLAPPRPSGARASADARRVGDASSISHSRMGA